MAATRRCRGKHRAQAQMRRLGKRWPPQAGPPLVLRPGYMDPCDAEPSTSREPRLRVSVGKSTDVRFKKTTPEKEQEPGWMS